MGTGQGKESYALEIKPSAIKELEGLSAHLQDRFRNGFLELARDPFRRRPGADIKRLVGRPGFWRLRVGGYRAIYVLEGRTVVITEVGPRPSVYR